MSKPVYYIAAPHYGAGFTAPTVQALLTATQQQPPPDVQIQFECASLLACCFNRLWAECLNRRVTEPPGRRPDYFAMLHSDVGPEPGWLDIMTAEMERTGADVISCVVAIKDARGLTSTGYLDPATGQPRRFTLKEIHSFPETFDAAGCGHPDKPLLVNTGCWLARLDRPWVENFPGFTIMDGIQKVGGLRLVSVLSEDWNASKWWAENGVKVFATRKVEVSHLGGNDYRNSCWGTWDTDQGDGALVAEMLAQRNGHTKSGRPFWPSKELPDVDGWLSDDEGRALSRLAAGKDVLEIGSYCGRSTIWLARTARHVLAIDTFDGRGIKGHEPRDTERVFLNNLHAHHVAFKVTTYRGEAARWLADPARPNWPPYEFDLCFVDGAHDEESVWADALACLEVLRPGGLLVFHDYVAEPGVTRVVNRLLADGATQSHMSPPAGSLAVVRPAARQVGNAEQMAAAGGA